VKKLCLACAILSMLSIGASANAKPLKVGLSAGPYTDVSKFAADLAKKQGLEVEVIEFTDYTIPNAALAQRDIDFNNYQSKKYLENQIKTRSYDFVAVATGIIVPIGLYSKKVSKIEDLPSGATIGIPNDPANGARALIFLERLGLIKLDPAKRDTAAPHDIVDNPKKLRVVELEAAQLPRSLDDTSASVVNLNYAVGAGLDPKRALSLEDYSNDFNTILFVTRADNKDDPDIRRFIDIYRSPEVKAFVEKRFDKVVPTTW
jgi:D-methionine transport system substrate-binding protein